MCINLGDRSRCFLLLPEIVKAFLTLSEKRKIFENRTIIAIHMQYLFISLHRLKAKMP